MESDERENRKKIKRYEIVESAKLFLLQEKNIFVWN